MQGAELPKIQDPFSLFDKQWALVTAGTSKSFNTMTISWGGLGTLWSRPVATVYVRPSRYTHDFMEREPLFTVSFFDGRYKKDLGILGSLSGRDVDKLAMTGLTPCAIDSSHGQTMGFEQAWLTLVCRKVYREHMDKSLIMPLIADEHYHVSEPAHTMYIGEVVKTLPEGFFKTN